MKRLGLTQRVEIDPRHGERRDCLDQRWTPFLLRCNFLPVPLSNRFGNVEEVIGGLGLDGVVLTGGNDIEGFSGTNTAPERDAFEHKLIDICTELEIPILGVCRGMQILNLHHGGSLISTINHAGTEHELEILQHGALGDKGHIRVNSYHDFAIAGNGLGSALRPLALTADGHVEAFDYLSQKHLGIMWHPER